MDAVITLDKLNFTYNKNKDNEYRALINVSLSIYPEEFIVVFGPSGCGKSTLLNIIAGLESPESGTLTIFGKDMTQMSRKEFAVYHRTQIGMIYQAYNLITTLTVLDNVALPQMFIDAGKKKREKIAMELLERFGIAPQAKKIPTELSGGQQQRIGIARAIVNNPQIVLADEPVGNLDSVSAHNVLEILADLNEKEKKTIILVTHNPENLIYADRIIYMKDGIITREVINKDKHREIQEKKELVPKTPTAEIADLMRAYHGLTPEQINILIMPYKSKIFAHHFISSRNLEETKVFEDLIQRRLLGTITEEEMGNVLNRASNHGGVGFDIRTTDKIVRRVNRIIRMAYFIYQKVHQRKNEKGEHALVTDEEKAEKLTDYLLKTCYYEHMDRLAESQIIRLRQAVKERIKGDVQKMDFYNTLDSSLKEGGVGLNSKTASAVTEELELILILGFGVITTIEQGGGHESGADDYEKSEGEENLPPADNNAGENVTAAAVAAQTPAETSAAIPETKAIEPPANLRLPEKAEKKLSEHEVLSALLKEPDAGEEDGAEPSDDGPKTLQDAIAMAQDKDEIAKHVKADDKIDPTL
jgi:putative ABC transport system ATP-binding protein